MRLSPRKNGLDLQSHPPVTGVLKWEILGSALGRCSRGSSGKSGCSGGCSRECSGKLGVLQGVLPRVLNVGRQQKEHSRKHSLEHPPISLNTLGSTPHNTPISLRTLGSTSASTSNNSHFSTPVTGGWDCKPTPYLRRLGFWRFFRERYQKEAAWQSFSRMFGYYSTFPGAAFGTSFDGRQDRKAKGMHYYWNNSNMTLSVWMFCVSFGLGSTFVLLIAWHKPGKNGRKCILAPPGQWGKHDRKMGKWPFTLSGPQFSHFWGSFPPFSWWAQNSFSATLFPFRAGGLKWGLYQAIRIAGQLSKEVLDQPSHCPQKFNLELLPSVPSFSRENQSSAKTLGIHLEVLNILLIDVGDQPSDWGQKRYDKETVWQRFCRTFQICLKTLVSLGNDR